MRNRYRATTGLMALAIAGGVLAPPAGAIAATGNPSAVTGHAVTLTGALPRTSAPVTVTVQVEIASHAGGTVFRRC